MEGLKRLEGAAGPSSIFDWYGIVTGLLVVLIEVFFWPPVIKFKISRNLPISTSEIYFIDGFPFSLDVLCLQIFRYLHASPWSNIRPSVHPSVRPSVRPSVHPFVCPWVRHAFLKYRGNEVLWTLKHQGTHRISFIHSFIHSFICSFIHSFGRILVRTELVNFLCGAIWWLRNHI